MKLKTDIHVIEGKREVSDFKNQTEALTDRIPQVHHIETNVQVNENVSFNMAFYAEFNTMKDLHFYSIHTLHTGRIGCFWYL